MMMIIWSDFDEEFDFDEGSGFDEGIEFDDWIFMLYILLLFKHGQLIF